MLSKEEIISIINQSTGTTAYHRFSVIANFPVITDGVLALAEAAGCFWLLDIIGSYQGNLTFHKAFQVWMIKVNREDTTAVVSGFYDATLFVRQEIPYTDFPFDEIKFFVIDGVILLASEY